MEELRTVIFRYLDKLADGEEDDRTTACLRLIELFPISIGEAVDLILLWEITDREDYDPDYERDEDQEDYELTEKEYTESVKQIR